MKRISRIVAAVAMSIAPCTAHAEDAVSAIKTVSEADMPRIPVTEPEDALATFSLAAGFQLEMVASEPMVSDPVAACFDEFGRMFVAEMHGYPFSQESTKLNPDGGGKKNAGIIRLLEDTNGDGKMDQSHVFADGLSWPTSVCCYNGGIFVLAPGYLYYLKDTTGDNKADLREIVLSGFGRGNVQALCNGLQWDLDNGICFAAGINPKELKHRGKPLFPVGKSDLRFNPRTEEFEIVSGGVQFGHSVDDWGTRFVCSNSNHIQQVVHSSGYLSRNPFLAAPQLVHNIAADGASARVYRTSPPEPWRIVRQKWRAADKGYKLVINKDGGWEFIPLDPSKPAGAVPTEYPAGFFTGATGVTIYRGDAYPESFRGNAYVGDAGGNLVHRKTLNTDNVIYRADRADTGEEIVASSDNWFRPVDFVNAPDGSLFILDMYRETIEHPYSIPKEIKKFLHLSSGDDRGRIYRLVSPNMKRSKLVKLGDLTNEQLVQQLNSENGWTRDTAQRLLWERQDTSVVPALEALLKAAKLPTARLHALCTLNGLNKISLKHVKTGIQDSHPRVRACAIRLSEGLLGDSAEAIETLKPLCQDDNPHVRFQLASSLGESDHPATVELLADIVATNTSAQVHTAVLSSCGNLADTLLLKLAALPNSNANSHVQRLISDLGVMIGANPDVAPALTVLEAAATANNSSTLLTALGRGLSRRGASVASLLASDKASDGLRSSIAAAFKNAATAAIAEESSPSARLNAVRLLGFADYETAGDALAELMSPQTPQDLQREVVKSLGTQKTDDITVTLLDGWRSYSPAVRRDVVDVLMAKPARTQQLLTAVESGNVGRSDIDRDKKQLMMNHRTSAIKTKSLELFGTEVTTKRSEVVAGHQDVLNLNGDVERGKAVFIKTCSVCHQVGKMGHAVAPNLNTVKNKSSADLLIAILDPNREAQPSFNTYTAVTMEGRNYNGIIAAETASSITLRRAEAKQNILLRNTLDELVANGLSLMPEGLEKDLSKQQLADVIAFVKAIKQ